jgi:hypothetical protein
VKRLRRKSIPAKFLKPGHIAPAPVEASERLLRRLIGTTGPPTHRPFLRIGAAVRTRPSRPATQLNWALVFDI